MRIIVQDYAGHPFPVDLSRALAARGHDVLHLYSASNTTPQGPLDPRPGDPATYQCHGVRLAEKIDKGSLFKRRRQEIEYGRKAIAQMEAFRPDVVISGNTPLDPQRMIQRWNAAKGVRFVFWLQDITGVASERLLSKRIPVVGRQIGRHYLRMEADILRRSDRVVVISEDFRPIVQEFGVADGHIVTIENWAPLAELPVRPRVNPWSDAQGVSDAFTFIYTGTIGMKHNPRLLLRLAERFQSRGDVQVIVASESIGAKWLRDQTAQTAAPNIRVLPFQPFSDMPDVMGSADVLVAILEPDAGVFSVPSKVLSYLCAGRALLLAVPPENLAARIVAGHGAGEVVPPTDEDAFLAAAERLVGDPDRRAQMGQNARRYAETTFDIDRITEKFLDVFQVK